MVNLKVLATGALAIAIGLSLAQQAGPQGGSLGPGQGPGGQRGPGGPGGMQRGPAGPRLLMHPDVQKELKLTDEQKQQLGRLMPPMGPGGPGGFGPGGGGPGGPPQGGGFSGGQQRGQGGPPQGGGFGGGQQRGQGGPPQGGGFGGGQQRGQGGPGGPGGPGFGQDQGEMEKKIQEILTDDQYKRYKEIELQVQGAPAVLRPDVSQKLGITEEQRQQIRQILESNRPQMQPPQGGDRPDPEKMRAEMEKRREEMNKKVLAVLTADQRSKWQTMLGKPFKLTQPAFGPGGPGGPPPGGPGGGGQQRGGGG
jgi:hypothetical protein